MVCVFVSGIRVLANIVFPQWFIIKSLVKSCHYIITCNNISVQRKSCLIARG